MNSIPTIMVSSTFYDLRQIRTDLNAFISIELGYNPLLSEFSSFPVDPSVDTIENCRLRVEQDADIMVLIIGGRYGSIDIKRDKSITNIEFLTAKAKSIPIYVFIDKSILSILPVWKSNPNIDYSSVVDTPRLFEFVELVRSKERVWTFGFENAKDIIATLRIQFAILLQEGLKLKRLLSGNGIPRFMESLRPKSLRLALEKPAGWEYRLFFQSWIDEVERRADLIKEYRAELKLDSSIYIPAINAAEWFQTQMYELTGYVESLNRMINEYAGDAFGEPGVPGDEEQIVWVSQIMGFLLERIIRWAQRIRCARYEPPFDLVAPEAALFADDLVSKFEVFPKECLEKVEASLAGVETNGPQKLVLTFVMEISNTSRFDEAINKAKKYFGLS